jgi:hypothetical protein
MERDMKAVPTYIWMKGHRFKTSYNGQNDHIRANIRCRRCDEIGHYQSECVDQSECVKSGWEIIAVDKWNENDWKKDWKEVTEKEDEQKEKEEVQNESDSKEREVEVQKVSVSGGEDKCEVIEKDGESDGASLDSSCTGILVIDLEKCVQDKVPEVKTGVVKDTREVITVKSKIENFENRAASPRREARGHGSVGDLVPATRSKRGREELSGSEISPSEKPVSSRPCLGLGRSRGPSKPRRHNISF